MTEAAPGAQSTSLNHGNGLKEPCQQPLALQGLGWAGSLLRATNTVISCFYTIIYALGGTLRGVGGSISNKTSSFINLLLLFLLTKLQGLWDFF